LVSERLLHCNLFYRNLDYSEAGTQFRPTFEYIHSQLFSDNEKVERKFPSAFEATPEKKKKKTTKKLSRRASIGY